MDVSGMWMWMGEEGKEMMEGGKRKGETRTLTFPDSLTNSLVLVSIPTLLSIFSSTLLSASAKPRLTAGAASCFLRVGGGKKVSERPKGGKGRRKRERRTITFGAVASKTLLLLLVAAAAVVAVVVGLAKYHFTRVDLLELETDEEDDGTTMGSAAEEVVGKTTGSTVDCCGGRKERQYGEEEGTERKEGTYGSRNLDGRSNNNDLLHLLSDNNDRRHARRRRWDGTLDGRRSDDRRTAARRGGRREGLLGRLERRSTGDARATSESRRLQSLLRELVLCRSVVGRGRTGGNGTVGSFLASRRRAAAGDGEAGELGGGGGGRVGRGDRRGGRGRGRRERSEVPRRRPTVSRELLPPDRVVGMTRTDDVRAWGHGSDGFLVLCGGVGVDEVGGRGGDGAVEGESEEGEGEEEREGLHCCLCLCEWVGGRGGGEAGKIGTGRCERREVLLASTEVGLRERGDDDDDDQRCCA